MSKDCDVIEKVGREIPRCGALHLERMGGGQSQERVVNVEETTEEDGGGQITVSSKTIEYIL